MVFFLVLPIFLLTTFLVFTDYPNGRLARDVHKWIKTPPTELPDFRTVAAHVQSGAVNIASIIWEYCDHLGRRLQTAYNTGFEPSSEAGRKVYEMYTVTAERLKPVVSAAKAGALRAYEACQVLAERIQAEYQQHFPFLKPFDEKNSNIVETSKGKKKKASVEVPVFTGVDSAIEGQRQSTKTSDKAKAEEQVTVEKKDSKNNAEKEAKQKKSSSDTRAESADKQGEKIKNDESKTEKKMKSKADKKGDNNKDKSADKTGDSPDVKKPEKKADRPDKESNNREKKVEKADTGVDSSNKKEEGTKKKEGSQEKKGDKPDRHSH
jgi:hypothetical protein